MNTTPNTVTLRSVATQRGAMHCAIASRNGAALAFYAAAWNDRIPSVRDVQACAKWREAAPIPTGEAIEIECELIEVTARTFAPIVRRTAAAGALIGAATVAQAHPGHNEDRRSMLAPWSGLSAPWWPCCAWPPCAPLQPVAIGVRNERARYSHSWCALRC